MNQKEEICGKLIRALYGTRDAPLAWQTVVKKDMKELGFEECKVTNGVFTHAVRDLRTIAHVDDSLLSGEYHDLIWSRDKLLEEYELKVQIAGMGSRRRQGVKFSRLDDWANSHGHRARGRRQTCGTA